MPVFIASSNILNTYHTDYIAKINYSLIIWESLSKGSKFLFVFDAINELTTN